MVPSIYADAPHESRSERYRYIPTAAVPTELRKEGFEPFMVTQTRVRNEDRREHTKHIIRLRHANQVNHSIANEIILLNSHDGTSSYQMLAGGFRFVCSNGLVCGNTVADVRIPHKGDIAGQVIEGAYEVLNGFERVRESREAMQSVTLDDGEAEVFARAALALKYDDPDKPAPITESQILMPRRFDDRRPLSRLVYLALIRQFEQSPAKVLAATLTSWLEPIVRMWRFTKSNGITEGFHTKMEMLSRRAYGFRNFENYRLRVLAQCGWSGVINRV